MFCHECNVQLRTNKTDQHARSRIVLQRADTNGGGQLVTKEFRSISNKLHRRKQPVLRVRHRVGLVFGMHSLTVIDGVCWMRSDKLCGLCIVDCLFQLNEQSSPCRHAKRDRLDGQHRLPCRISGFDVSGSLKCKLRSPVNN